MQLLKDFARVVAIEIAFLQVFGFPSALGLQSAVISAVLGIIVTLVSSVFFVELELVRVQVASGAEEDLVLA